MIKYRLICKDCNITFDSWFSSSNEYERLKKKKFLNCHNCNSSSIHKTLMSPSISTSKKNSMMDKKIQKYKRAKQTILKYQEFIKKNFDYVGENFAYEVRSIHYNNKKMSKGIYGTTTKEDLKDLKEEGIETEIMPWIEDNEN
ncbi:hypothetical protein VP91_00002520 [Candidatus Pelagibacter ubique]|uniref:DUF1178 family protein n=1 Tax=Pelagibacter ubique TaxID=198252 RepID=A0ABX1T1M3_PELUQ|nr:DUF1178 family protein [Candidatus Pelagibacter ubique]NMN67115.1 hypothetical protein [Candidatus Pelagibacter ubique]